MRFFITSLLALLSMLVQAQLHIADSILRSRGEVIIECEVPDKAEIEHLTRIISVDRLSHGRLTAYCNQTQFEEFLKLGIDYEVVVNSFIEADYPVLSYMDFLNSNWDVYPTWQAYDSLMHRFQSLYPALCRIDTIGQTNNGRLILAAVLKGNSAGRPVPQFLYSSSIHGDETTGYILLLRLIDYLLTGYGIDPEITRILDSTEVWINPLANPDGTYKGGNQSVTGAIRGNANYVDLNRNYPDPEDGQHPDQNPWQTETMAFMALAQQQSFVMSANFHGGAEVVNYPWDTWSRLPADNQWWVMVSKQYADTAMYFSPNGYMDDFTTGYVNGYTWYSISGGRQDYMNYFHHCREVTLEISNTKNPPAMQLPNFWNYNYRSLINYLNQLQFGVGGIITDSITSLPLKAKVYISGFDKDSSHVYSRLSDGYYKRLLYAGTWNLTFSADGYVSKTIQLQVQNGVQTWLSLALAPSNSGIEEPGRQRFTIFPNPADGNAKLIIPELMNISLIQLISFDGKLVREFSALGNNQSEILLTMDKIGSGVYFLRIATDKGVFTERLIKI